MVSAAEANRLFTLFGEQASKIDVALDARDVDQSRTLIQGLQKLVSAQAAVLPSRDLKIYRERIEGYKKKLDDIKAPKKRFAFSRAAKDGHADRVHELAQRPAAVQQDLEAGTSGGDGDRKTGVANATFTLSNKCDETLDLNAVHGEVELSNIVRCRVRIQGCPSTLYMNDVHECVVVCDPVASSVLIVGFRGSSLQVACQQLRIHKATNATFRLHITSR